MTFCESPSQRIRVRDPGLVTSQAYIRTYIPVKPRPPHSLGRIDARVWEMAWKSA